MNRTASRLEVGGQGEIDRTPSGIICSLFLERYSSPGRASTC